MGDIRQSTTDSVGVEKMAPVRSGDRPKPNGSSMDPNYVPKRLTRPAARSETLPDLVNQSKVMVLYTGGTIGMVKNSQGAYVPRPNALEQEVRSYPQLHDKDYAAHLGLPPSSGPLVLPDIRGQKNRIVYEINEYEPLLDSSNMTVDDWVRIAQDIEKHYPHYNGFVVLHGTDTMAYTASALSFSLENLGKTVVVTGSQIPIFEARSDGRDNFLNSLIMAGNYCIPEVTIVFNHKLYRGNRTSKVSASHLDAFDSPNLPPLVTLGIDIHINWHNIYRSQNIAALRVHSKMNRNVGILRIFPSIRVETIRAFLQPPIEGVVLQTYGAGNLPTSRIDLLDELQKAAERDVIIVSITQCTRGFVAAAYEGGVLLEKAGVIPGGDMTPEAALTKLAYLLGKDEWDLKMKRRMIRTNLCGEMTMHHQPKINDLDLIRAVAETLRISSSSEMESLRASLYPVVVCAFAARGDMKSLMELDRTGADFSIEDYDHRTPLHLAAASGNAQTVEFLLTKGASVHAKDLLGATPLLVAVKCDHQEIIQLLRKAGAYLHLSAPQQGDLITMAAATGDLKRLTSMQLAGASLGEVDTFGRHALHVAVERDQMDVVKYLLNQKEVDLKNSKDVYGRTPFDVATALDRKEAIQILNS